MANLFFFFFMYLSNILLYSSNILLLLPVKREFASLCQQGAGLQHEAAISLQTSPNPAGHQHSHKGTWLPAKTAMQPHVSQLWLSGVSEKNIPNGVFPITGQQNQGHWEIHRTLQKTGPWGWRCRLTLSCREEDRALEGRKGEGKQKEDIMSPLQVPTVKTVFTCCKHLLKIFNNENKKLPRTLIGFWATPVTLRPPGRPLPPLSLLLLLFLPIPCFLCLLLLCLPAMVYWHPPVPHSTSGFTTPYSTSSGFFVFESSECKCSVQTLKVHSLRSNSSFTSFRRPRK